MSDAKLRAAQDLIDAEEYAAAKSILVTLDDPEAQEMLMWVDEMQRGGDPEMMPRKKLRPAVQVEPSGSRGLSLILIILAMLIILVVAMLFFVSPVAVQVEEDDRIEQILPESDDMEDLSEEADD